MQKATDGVHLGGTEGDLEQECIISWKESTSRWKEGIQSEVAKINENNNVQPSLSYMVTMRKQNVLSHYRRVTS